LVVAGFSLRLEALACGKQRNLKVATTSLRLEALACGKQRNLKVR